MMSRRFVRVLFCLACVGFACSARAIEESEAFFIEPMEVRIELPGASQVTPSVKIKIVNKEDHDVNVRIDCFHRDEDVEGAERRSLTKDVKVDASDFTLPAGASRYVKLSYSGSRKISREHEFRIVVRQQEEKEGENVTRSLDMSFVHVVSFRVSPEED